MGLHVQCARMNLVSRYGITLAARADDTDRLQPTCRLGQTHYASSLISRHNVQILRVGSLVAGGTQVEHDTYLQGCKQISALAASADGLFIATGCSAGSLRLFQGDATGLRLLRRWQVAHPRT